jgi:hypothetical protein
MKVSTMVTGLPGIIAATDILFPVRENKNKQLSGRDFYQMNLFFRFGHQG